MSSIAARTYLTPEEYIALERKATLKSEYLSGEIVAMSGASVAHNLITVNTVTQLYNQLIEGRCRVFTGDMRVGIGAGVSYFYPDVSVVCDEPRFEDDALDILTNPQVIVEVLSDSTENYDRARNLNVIVNWNHCKNISRFHRIRFEWNTTFAKVNSGSSANFTRVRRCYHLFRLRQSSP